MGTRGGPGTTMCTSYGESQGEAFRHEAQLFGKRGELERGLAALAEAQSLEELERAHTVSLGRKSKWSEVQRSLGSLDPDDRKRVGRRANEVKSSLEAVHEERRRALDELAETALLDADAVDVTLPGRRLRPGSLHPLTIVEDEIVAWYRDEHVPMLSKVPGWLRSRIYRTPSRIEGDMFTPVRIVTLHEYARASASIGAPPFSPEKRGALLMWPPQAR